MYIYLLYGVNGIWIFVGHHLKLLIRLNRLPKLEQLEINFGLRVFEDVLYVEFSDDSIHIQTK